MADNFDDIPGLWAEFNAGIGSTVTHSAGTASVITANAGSLGAQTLNSVGSVGYDPGVIQAGEMDACRFVVGTEARMENDLLSTVPAGTPCVYVMAFQLDAIATGEYGMEIEAGATQKVAYSRSGSNHAARVSNSTENTGVARTTSAVVFTCRYDPATSDVDMWVDGVDTNYATAQADSGGDWNRMCFGGRWGDATGALGGNLGILAIYTTLLNDAQVDEVNTLARYWLDNGEAPSTGPEPSTTFGPVSTNDDPSVTGWQWEESPNGADWANVGTILTDISGATTTTLTVNSAPIEADQTLVRCKAFSAKEPAPDGVVSHSAILTVQGGAPPVTPEGIVFQTDWSNDIGVANGYPDDDTGWDMVAKSNDGTVIGELYDVPWGFWYTTIPGQCEEELWRQTAKFKVQKDEVYGNNCFRYKYGDAGQGADSRQDVNFSLPLGTKYTGLNDFYVRFTIRFPRNNNHNYGGTDYWKWARFSSNCWVPDPGEEQLDVSQNRHNNPASSQSIISWWGEAKFNDRSWKLSTAYPLSQQFPDGYGGAGGLQEQQLSYKDGSVKSNPGQISALDPVRMEEAYNQPPRPDGSFVLDVEQVYHTVEFHIKSMTDEASDDGVFEMWFDGVKQIAASDKGYGTEDMPHRDVTLGNQHAATLPDYKRAITYARGAGYNLMEWMGNIFDYWQAWNEYDGGVYIKDFVVSTSRITHDYEAVGSIDNRATTYQQEAPEEVTILTVYPTPQERLVGDDDAGSNSTFQHGFSARSTATCTWYITRDSGGGRENLNLNADWSVNRGGNRGDSSTWNNCIALSREGTGFTLDDNGVIELHISTESHGEVWSDPVRLNVIEASE